MLLNMAGRTSWTLINSIVALVVMVGVDLLLVPPLGVPGAGIGWAVAILTNNLLPLTQLVVSMGRTLLPRNLLLHWGRAHGETARLRTWLIEASLALSSSRLVWLQNLQRRRVRPAPRRMLDRAVADRSRVRWPGSCCRRGSRTHDAVAARPRPPRPSPQACPPASP